MHRIYLDHAAAAPLDKDVYRAMQPYFGEDFSNASSLHKSGRAAASAIAYARHKVARTVASEPDEIIFTGSGTESDNLAVLGASRALRNKGMHVVVSAIEHKAVMESARTLRAEGFEVSIAPVDESGRISPERVAQLVRDDTTLVSVMYANNEIGTIEPIQELVQVLYSRRKSTGLPLIHTDACQAAGYLPLDVDALGVDLMTLNGSKAYGPRGVGVLYRRHGTPLAPLIVGGHQEGGMRAGTESVPLIVGMAEALEKADALRAEEHARLSTLRSYFVGALYEAVPDIIVNGDPNNVLPHIVHVTVPAIEGESMVLLLDEQGIECATGSACSANDLRPSHVLSAIGQEEDIMHGSLRFSFGRTTDKAALDHVLSVFPAIVDRLKATSALTTNILYEKKR